MSPVRDPISLRDMDHREQMRLGSMRLRDRLFDQHPRIMQCLTGRTEP